MAFDAVNTNPVSLLPKINSLKRTYARPGCCCGTRCPALATSAYVQLRSWWTMPAKAPVSSYHGVEGARVKPWVPPKVVFCKEREEWVVRWGM